MEKLNRVFDQVALSREREDALLADLLNEKREVSSMKQNRKRRIPAAALVAAVLVVVLAGTALAAEYLGWIRIEPISHWMGPDGLEEGDAYAVFREAGRFPAEELSEEVFAIGEEIGDIHRPCRTLNFESWQACEDFLGVELANNPRLEQMQKMVARDNVNGDSHASVTLSYEKLMPSYATVSAYYWEGDYITAYQTAQLRTQYAPDRDPDQWDVRVPQNGEEPLVHETYITAGGIEAELLIDTYDTSISTFTSCYASFIRDNVCFGLGVSVRTHSNGEPTNAPDPIELTKEILDAYE